MWPKTKLTYDPSRPVDVELWLTTFKACADILPLLTQEEQEKAQELTHLPRREEYITTRALQRHAISKATGQPPADLKFTKGPNHKPHHAQTAFNLSNCKGLVACAISLSELGLDIEPHDRGQQALEVATRVYTDHERKQLNALAPKAREEAAIELWTLKEAVMKASGKGFHLEPSSFELTVQQNEISATSETSDLGGNWFLTLSILKSGHALALATTMPNPNIRIHSFPIPYRLGLSS